LKGKKCEPLIPEFIDHKICEWVLNKRKLMGGWIANKRAKERTGYDDSCL
jgi:hypothetical protein